MLGYNPVIDGLRTGQLVEVVGDEELDGHLGQLQSYDAESGNFCVLLLGSGRLATLPSKHIQAVCCPDSGPEAFDAVLGPRTDRSALGTLLAEALAERGCCVLRVAQAGAAERLTRLLAALRSLDSQGGLGRLAQEVEPGYLGRYGQAKVRWLEPPGTEDWSADGLPREASELLAEDDRGLTALAELLLPFSEDCLGASVAERTPALLCQSMSEAEADEFDNPEATDEVIEEFYSTWSRGVVRLVHFLGPGSGSAILKAKADTPRGEAGDIREVSMLPNSILAFREDTFEYSLNDPADGETCWLTSFLMRRSPQWRIDGEVAGDTAILSSLADGPPPPTSDAGNLVAICAISIQACGKMTSHEKEWAAYASGCDAQLEMPLLRFDYRPYYSDESDTPMGTTYVKHFSVQEGIELFDNKIFEISNMESLSMDPICRQVMEVGYLSVFKLGFTKKYANNNPTHASVSVGNDKQEWLHMPEAPQTVATNNQLAILANRFNYVFNLKGGSYVCDTACSSSLVAAHLGKMNLLERRWDPLEWHLGMGAGLTLTVGAMVGSCASHMLSPGGRCFTFNSTANGYNRGDGTAAMLLKAGACDDSRLCYFRGSQMGQDGRSASMSAPNGPAQEKCIWGAIREARMTPPESTVWDCHGTGTSLGDPIEVGAVRKVQIKMKRPEPLLVASSKSNTGHLEGSAAALAMNKCVIIVLKLACAATQHLNVLNPHLDHTTFDAVFTTEHSPFKYRQGHSQVSSFGVGGTNGHAIFWGEGAQLVAPDYRKTLTRKLKAAPPIIVDGPDPSSWLYSGPDYNAGPGVEYRIVVNRDPVTREEMISYQKVSKTTPPPIEFYTITGSHNDWTEDRLLEGDLQGLHYQDVEVPDEGFFEFRILAEGDEARVIAPETTTSKRLTPILGPEADLRTSWLVKGLPPGSITRIEFFSPDGGPRSVSWFALQEE